MSWEVLTMKSKISLFNRAVFRRNLTGYFGLWTGLFVACLIYYPASIYSKMVFAARHADEGAGEQALQFWRSADFLEHIWNMNFLIIIISIAALAAAMLLFSYLFAARSSNMMHTYPVTRVSLFVTNYVTGLLFLLVPLFVSAVLGLAVAASFGAVTGEVLKSFLMWMGTAAVINLFFFSLSVCVLMFVGNIIAVPVLYFILNFLCAGMVRIAEWMVNAVCYGVESFSLHSGLLTLLTPISCLLNLNLYTGYTESRQFVYNYSQVKVLVWYTLAAAAFAGIALAAYQKKHIETAGDVITVNWLKPLFRWGTAVCTSALGALLFGTELFGGSFAAIVICAAVIGAAVFFIAQMLLERSVHVFTKKRLCECLVYTAVIGIIYAGLDADVFGLEKKVPNPGDIKEVWVSSMLELYAGDADEIAWVQDIHKQIIASKKEFEQAEKDVRKGNNNMFWYFSLEYRMKDGSRLTRTYHIPEQDVPGSVSGQIHEYAGRPDVILRRYFGIHYPDITVYSGTWNSNREDVPAIRVNEDTAQELYKAFVSDILAGRGAEQNEDAVSYGALYLNVRDEAGFVSPYDRYNFYETKEGSAEIWVSSDLKNLSAKLHELGCISDEMYEQKK